MESSPSRRPRFSLLTLLLVTTIVGLAVVVGLQWREIEPLRREVRELRREMGKLTIDDPRKAYAIALPVAAHPAAGDHRTSWRGLLQHIGE